MEVQLSYGGGCFWGGFRLEDCDRGVVAGRLDGQGHETASWARASQRRAEDAMKPEGGWAHAHRAVGEREQCNQRAMAGSTKSWSPQKVHAVDPDRPFAVGGRPGGRR